MRIVYALLMVIGLSAPAVAEGLGDASWWSVGPMFSTNLIGDDRPELRLVDGMVELAAVDADARIRLVGEAHLLFPLGSAIEIGPALLAAPSTSEIIDAIGGGVTVAFKRGAAAMGVNLGVWVDPNAQFPSPEFLVGQSAPAGATMIRTFRQTTYTFAITVTLMGVRQPDSAIAPPPPPE